MSIQASAVTYTKAGPDLAKVLTNTKFDIDLSKIKPTQVVVKALGTPINPSDVVQVLGVYPSPPKFQQLGNDSDVKYAIGGNEGVFKVVAVGNDVADYKVGDWVIPKLPSFGTWRTHAIADATENPFIKVSSDDDSAIDLNEAATISINPSTALQLIETYNDWKQGDWIIANAGNSQVNQYLIQIAKIYSINTILIIRSGKQNETELKNELKKLGATLVFNDEEIKAPKFIKELPELTSNGNVRLALNSVGDETVAILIDALSQDGTLITYGASGGNKKISYDSTAQLFKNITTKAYWLTKNTKANPQLKVDTINKLLKLYQNKVIQSPNFNKAKFDQSQDLAQLVLHSISSTTGKQVIVYE